MNGDMAESAGWQSFVDAYATYRASRNTHPDLADFYRSRYDVVCNLVGVDAAATGDFDREQRVVRKLLDQFADAIPTLNSPFSRYLEAPSSIVRLYGSFGPGINELFVRQKRNYLDVMDACAAELWGACPVEVTDDDLCRYDVGRRNEPDEVDYF
jgi:hypothetical protein